MKKQKIPQSMLKNLPAAVQSGKRKKFDQTNRLVYNQLSSVPG